MASSASTFLALRYLRHTRSFVSVITVISVLGVAVGVLMMIVVRSVMQGFEHDFRDALIGAEPHLLISREEGASDPRDVEALLTRLRASPDVLSASSYAGGVIYVEKDGAQTGIQIFGLPPAAAGAHLEKMRPHLIEGSLNLADGTLALSNFTANQIGAQLGDTVTVYAAGNVTDVVRKFREVMNERDEQKKRDAYRGIKLHPVELKVAGVTRGESGGIYGYMSQKSAQDILGMGEMVSGITLELRQPRAVKEVVAWLQSAGLAPEEWKLRPWTDAGDARLAAMENEQTMMQLVLAIIAVVAAFSVMNTTITVTTQKRRDIGVLTALGGRQGQIVSVFVIQGLIVGVIGTALGLAGAFLVLWLRNDLRALLAQATGGQIHAVEGVFLSTIPAYVSAPAVALTCCIAIVLCVVAALPPAYFAARLDPAAALRD